MKTKKAILYMCLALIGGIIIVGSYFFTHNKPALQENKAQQKVFVALGDSVSAGVGLYEPSDSSACDRSNESYPSLLAKKENYSLTFLACSGATVQNGILGAQTIGNGTVAPQIDGLPIQPPDLITLSVGANDVRWVSLITKCILSACGSAGDSQQIGNAIASFQLDLENTLKKIESKYETDPKVIVSGYYNLYPTSNNVCTVKSPLEDSELNWVQTQTNALNSAIKETVLRHSSVRYLAIDFTGHLLCSSEPWLQDIGDPAPYHPNETGQISIAEQLAKLL